MMPWRDDGMVVLNKIWVLQGWTFAFCLRAGCNSWTAPYNSMLENSAREEKNISRLEFFWDLMKLDFQWFSCNTWDENLCITLRLKICSYWVEHQKQFRNSFWVKTQFLRCMDLYTPVLLSLGTVPLSLEVSIMSLHPQRKLFDMPWARRSLGLSNLLSWERRNKFGHCQRHRSR